MQKLHPRSLLSPKQDALSGGEGEGAARTLAADEAQEEVAAAHLLSHERFSKEGNTASRF